MAAPTSRIADELEQRLQSLMPVDPINDFITWDIPVGSGSISVAQVPIQEMVKSAEIAADLLLNQPLDALGGQSYSEINNFTLEDQRIVEMMIDKLVEGDPLFAQNAEARHALAATAFAFERDRSQADVINRTFRHFI